MDSLIQVYQDFLDNESAACLELSFRTAKAGESQITSSFQRKTNTISIGNSSIYKIYIDKFEPMNSLAFWIVDIPKIKYVLNTNQIINAKNATGRDITDIILDISSIFPGYYNKQDGTRAIKYSADNFKEEYGARIIGNSLFITESSILIKNSVYKKDPRHMNPGSNMFSNISSLYQIYSELSSYQIHQDYLNLNHHFTKPTTPTSNPSCYIATMAYQDINHPQVEYLRRVRDERLLSYRLGQAFVKYYYKYSPKLVERLKNHQRVNRVIRKGLDVLISLLKHSLPNTSLFTS